MRKQSRQIQNEGHSNRQLARTLQNISIMKERLILDLKGIKIHKL